MQSIAHYQVELPGALNVKTVQTTLIGLPGGVDFGTVSYCSDLDLYPLPDRLSPLFYDSVDLASDGKRGKKHDQQ